MKRIIVLLALFAASPTLAAVLSWSPPATDVSGIPFSIAEQNTMTYRTFISQTQFRTWTVDVITPPGATSATVTEPQPGTTLWYTADVTYLTMTSEMAGAIALTRPFPPPQLRPPNPPGGLAVQ